MSVLNGAESHSPYAGKMYTYQNNDTRFVIYLDETWVNQNQTKGYIWQNELNSKGLKVPKVVD